ncbi:hypothetical protein ACB098_08G162800 [Castanea mollissima]
MEIVPSSYYENLERYWGRRRCLRLNGADSNKKKLMIARLGGTAHGVRRTTPKHLFNTASPTKVLAKFHDAYVDMMILLARNVGNLNKVSRQISMVSSGEEVDSGFV